MAAAEAAIGKFKEGDFVGKSDEWCIQASKDIDTIVKTLNKAMHGVTAMKKLIDSAADDDKELSD
eukprot:CAMPEP_0195040602 /NCGR_PEP_ID=MMETSP0326_2-20130528/80422_1 /TAXON_ID=2866 ORGANISM="Crypthecodinium cohnii, Strain Seligo" /NCGR_SAMPLE_ID=MMETSP0326_2 /ASSEMBLY_ACC=CAM_ASM_000348 /LENGTH=64 /DNA_ID=CAMNT_0040067533 /DNA_START=777 /DNA_END=971 /DNA_ORIENTATION=+